jgi:hypothetical protein
MKCTACGKEFEEGFAYCPWCGSKTTTTATTEEATRLKVLAVEEKLRTLRRGEKLSTILGGLCIFGGGLTLFYYWLTTQRGSPAPSNWAVALAAVLFVLGVVSFSWARGYGRQADELVKKLEKGRPE